MELLIIYFEVGGGGDLPSLQMAICIHDCVVLLRKTIMAGSAVAALTLLVFLFSHLQELDNLPYWHDILVAQLPFLIKNFLR